MRISMWVEMSQEVEVEIGADDIRAALGEAFTRVTDGQLFAANEVTALVEEMDSTFRAAGRQVLQELRERLGIELEVTDAE